MRLMRADYALNALMATVSPHPGTQRRIYDNSRSFPVAPIEKAIRRCYIASIVTQKEDNVLTYIEPTATAARPASLAKTPITSDAILALVLKSLDDDKAEEIVTIDLRDKSAMADHMIICSGRSTRQVSAIAQKLLDRLKEKFRLSARAEGKDVGDWVLIDAGDVVVHIFRPEVRDFYQLEKMWQDAGSKPVA